jgi:MFS family permease
MRPSRLTAFAGAVFIAESAFYAVVPPLVPGFVRDTHMTTTEVGILVAAYPAGVLLAAIPSMVLVNRRGVRTTTIAGLGALVIATLGFAWSASPLMLDASRLLQGVGGAVAWAGALAWLTSEAADDRRGSAIGGAVGAALIGMVMGPAIGAAASHYGRGLVFSLMAIVMAALALWSPASTGARVARRDWAHALGRLFRSPSANLGNGLLVVIGVVNGTVASLVPLLVARRHGTAITIAVILATNYLVSSLLNVAMGRTSDRIGRAAPTVVGLAVAAVLIPVLPQIGRLLVLAVVTIVASAAVSSLWTPTAAMVSDGADRGQSAQAVAVATLNAAWAAGISAGAIAVSRLADVTGFTAPFILVGVLCAAAAAATLLTYRLASMNKEKAWTLV